MEEETFIPFTSNKLSTMPDLREERELIDAEMKVIKRVRR